MPRSKEQMKDGDFICLLDLDPLNFDRTFALAEFNHAPIKAGVATGYLTGMVLSDVEKIENIREHLELMKEYDFIKEFKLFLIKEITND